MTRWKHKSDDEKVKAKLVEMIGSATDKEWDKVTNLANAYTKLRSVELKQDEGDWGESLTTPAESTNAAQVRS